MKKALLLGIGIVITAGMAAGCAGNKALLTEMSSSTTSSIFQDGEENVPPAPGYLALRIDFSLKVHKRGICFAKDIHGTPDYNVVLNIDGQAIQLDGTLERETSEPRGLADPEAGDGIRYRFSKSLRLKAGSHRIVVAIPHDGIAVDRKITLVDGQVNNLVIKPLYGTVPGMRRQRAFNATSFTQGVRGVQLTLNGRII